MEKNILRGRSEGDIGILRVKWNAEYKKWDPNGDAHVLNWLIKDGSVKFLDGQAKLDSDSMGSFLRRFMDSSLATFAKVGNVSTGIDFDETQLKDFVDSK